MRQQRECWCGNTFVVDYVSSKKKFCSAECRYESQRANHPKALALIGERFGSLVVLRQYEGGSTSYQKKRWVAVCDCGNERIVTTQDLRRSDNRAVRHCEDPVHWRGAANRAWQGGKFLSGTKWKAIQASALRRGFKFEVTLAEVETLMMHQNWICALTGRNLDIKSMSLDRINSKQGYVTGNLQWLHRDVNRAKMDLSDEDFIQLCREVVRHVDRH